MRLSLTLLALTLTLTLAPAAASGGIFDDDPAPAPAPAPAAPRVIRAAAPAAPRGPDTVGLRLDRLENHVWGVGKVPPLEIPPAEGGEGGRCKSGETPCDAGLACVAGKCVNPLVPAPAAGTNGGPCRPTPAAGAEAVVPCDNGIACINGKCEIPVSPGAAPARKIQTVEERLELLCGTTNSCGEGAYVLTTAEAKVMITEATAEAQAKADTYWTWGWAIAILGVLVGMGIAVQTGRKTREDLLILSVEVGRLRKAVASAEDDD